MQNRTNDRLGIFHSTQRRLRRDALAGILFVKGERIIMNHYITGSAIRALREQQHLTQAQLAERLAVSDKTISKWETGVSHS